MVNSIKKIPRAKRVSPAPRVYTRSQDQPILRDRRRRPVEAGEDEFEARAISPNRFAGATLPERIVYKKLAQLFQSENAFIYQRSALGGRNFLGGFVIDFVIPSPEPPLALEVLGDFWHQAQQQYSDAQRALTLLSLGYDYEEVWEHDILHSDERLENILRTILGGRVSGWSNSAFS